MAKCMICGKTAAAMPCICGNCLPKKREMRRLPKKELDGIIEAKRAYWAQDVQTDAERETLLNAMAESRRAMDAKVPDMGYTLQQFLSGILGGWGLAQDATNKEIYTILKLLGWEVIEEV